MPPLLSALALDAVGPVSIDGVLDEAAWAEAPAITELLKYTPTEGGAPPGTTEVRFVQDDRFLYVGIRVTDTGYPIRARVSARERINADDQVGIYLDTFHDGRSGYIFYFNPLGVQQDIRHNAGTWNANWDTAFRSAGRVVDDGYEIEIAFPWRSLKYPTVDGDQTWGLIVTRKVPHEGAKYAFPDITRGKPLLFSEEAELRGLHPAPKGSGIELIPALTASQLWDGDRPFDQLDVDPWYDALRPSLDLRLGITPDLGLAATVNPDFSQVESDLADVRLNARFAFQFTERRPFFLDGIDLYQDRSGTLYSRSIAEPLYGVKLSGREGPVSVGVVHALDRSPLPSVHEAGTPGFDEVDIEGRFAEDTIARVRLDAFSEGWIGVTAADKRILGGPGPDGSAGAHDSGAVDVGVPFGERWLAGGSTQTSWTTDGDSQELWGNASEASLIRASGVGTGFGVSGSASTPDFRRETGFVNQTGLWTGNSWLDHTFTPGGAVDTWAPEVFASALEERDGDHYRRLGHRQELLVEGIHTFWAQATVDERRQDDAQVLGWSAHSGWYGQVGSLLELTSTGTVQRSLDFGTLGPALTLDATLDATLRTSGVRVDLAAAMSRHLPEGLDPETARLLRATLNWQWTRTLGTRLLVQDSRRDQAEGLERALVVSPLLTWLDVPGTAAYLGWTEQIDLLGGETTQRSIFAKVSVLVRP